MEPWNLPSQPPSPWPLPATMAPRARLTWQEWQAWQARHALRSQEPACVPFSDRALARLSFVRWLYRTGRLGPPGYDNV